MLQHLLTGSELSQHDILKLINEACEIKNNPGPWNETLKGKHLGMLFDKPSLRTRFSFSVAMQTLGGHFVEAVGEQRKKETPEDLIRVIQAYCHALVIRTFDDEFLKRMTRISRIPIINALTDCHHPCQILADLMTLHEKFSSLNGLTLSYIGDGNNILHSLLLLAPKTGINIHYCCPENYGPDKTILDTALHANHSGKIKAFSEPQDAVNNTNIVYTDTWDSMGLQTRDKTVFKKFKVDHKLMQLAGRDAAFMHCMPINRGVEVSHDLPDQTYSLVFQQSENRLHIQKSLLVNLLP